MNEYCLRIRRATVYLLIALACLGLASCEARKPLGCNVVAFISLLHFFIAVFEKRMVPIQIDLSNFPLTLKLRGKVKFI